MQRADALAAMACPTCHTRTGAGAGAAAAAFHAAARPGPCARCMAVVQPGDVVMAVDGEFLARGVALENVVTVLALKPARAVLLVWRPRGGHGARVRCVRVRCGACVSVRYACMRACERARACVACERARACVACARPRASVPARASGAVIASP